ncbi:MAG: KpsF/GutQ family sugar-phosphate isomerase, partial [Leadbetterella sp.]
METKLKENAISIAKKVLSDESEAIKSLINTIDGNFEQIVQAILNCKGKLVFSGIGKSAIVAKKIVATLNSTGQSAVFLHTVDALHGDIGIVSPDDMVVIISKSGNTTEIKLLLQAVKKLGIQTISMVSNLESYLAAQTDYVLNCHVDKEACSLNLAPTSSSTATIALGDALAVVLYNMRGFDSQGFANNHPGGSLGKNLNLRVSDLVLKHALPSVNEDLGIKEVILEITSKRLGA